MRSALNPLALSVLAAFAACGGAPQEAPETPSDVVAAGAAAPAKGSGDKPEGGASEEDKTADAASKQVPTTCEASGNVCLAPVAFAKRLCGGFHPDVALGLFAKGTPFTRAYLTRDTEAWNASGGSSSSDKLLFDEEVLILYQRVPDTGGMVVSGAGGGYDVLRWDGTCASLMAEEVRFKTPPKPKYAAIPWKSLDPKTRDALQADEKVGALVGERRKECKGATIGSVTAKCEKVDRQMSAGIVAYVRGGGVLPTPTSLP